MFVKLFLRDTDELTIKLWVGDNELLVKFRFFFSQEEQERLREEILAVKKEVILCSHVMI